MNVHLSKVTKYLDRGDGTCKYFNEKNMLCNIYDDRPDICRVELQYNKNHSHMYSWDKFISLNLEICHHLPRKK